MKRFDKGYIYSYLLSDLITSLVIVVFFLKDFFVDENAKAEDLIAAAPFLLIGIAVIYLCFILYRIMYYRTSGYELNEKEIRCSRGVLFRKRSVLDYKKVHAVNKRQSLIHRIFGIAVLTVDSGSTNTFYQAEITIVEKASTVDALLNKLNGLKEGATPTEDPSKEEVLLSEGDSLYSFTSKKKLLYTLINIISTAFFTVLCGASAIIVIGVCKLLLQLDALGSWGDYFLFSALVMLSAMLLLSAFSLIGCIIHSFVGYHKFTISKSGDSIQISFGLLERHTNTFNYDRIKAVKISQNLVQRILGFAAVKLEVIGYTEDTGKNNSQIGVLVPFCKYKEVGEILGKVLPDYVPEKIQEKAVSFFPFVSWFLLIFTIAAGLILLLTVSVLKILNVHSFIIWAVVISALIIGIIAIIIKSASAFLEYKTDGIAVNKGKITVYCGGFTKTVTVFRAENLIAVENVTTPLRKKHGIASYVLHIITNALTNEIKVHIQKDSLSEELEKLLIL